MKLLLTGADGFIGQHVYTEACRRGHVTSRPHINPLLMRCEQWDALMEHLDLCDVVLHLGAYSSNAGFEYHMQANFANNVAFFNDLAGECQRRNKRLVY